MTGNDLKDLIYEEILLYHYPNKLDAYTKEKLDFEKKYEEAQKKAMNKENKLSEQSSSDEEMI